MIILGTCDGCDAALEDGVVHDCPVLGTTVLATSDKDAEIEQLKQRVRDLEKAMAFEARVIEAQASLETESKYIGLKSKEYLRELVEDMRSISVGGTTYRSLAKAPDREYRSLIHQRRGHTESMSLGCAQCREEEKV